MSDSDPRTVPFDQLPLLPGSGLRHAWDVWGPGDNLGTLNRLTGPVVAAAMMAVRSGERVGLTLPMGLPDPPFFRRRRYTHSFTPMGSNAWDDWVDDFFLQCSSQWDGLRHVGTGTADGWYGGWSGGQPEADPGPLGIQHWARPGIIGRGVLVDLAGARDGTGYDPFDRVAFTPADLASALDAQGTTLQHGDILCVRTGWVDRYLALGPEERRALAAAMEAVSGHASAGLAGSEEMSRFLWDAGVAALPCDNPSVEVVPGDPAVGSLHRRLIPHLGFAIGELFDFGPLARACRREERYEFLFTSVPLNVEGGVGSPANAVAVL